MPTLRTEKNKLSITKFSINKGKEFQLAFLTNIHQVLNGWLLFAVFEGIDQ